MGLPQCKDSREITIPFNYVPRDYQIPLYNCISDGYKRGVAVWHRRSGKDKTLINFMVKEAFKRVGSYYYFFPKYSQGRKILWDGIDRDGFPFLNHIPSELRVSTNSTEMKIKLVNGSLFQVVGSDNIDTIVGTNPVGCVFSEFALQDPMGYEFVRPILRENGGFAVFNFTPRGHNHGYQLANMAQRNPGWFYELLTVDDTGVLTPHDIQMERDEGMSEDLINQEFYCFPPGVVVHSLRGQIPIEQILPGDFVLSHSGRFRKVRDTHNRYYEGTLLSIKTAANAKALQCTKDHRVRILDPTTQQYLWLEANKVTKGMYLVMPRRKIGLQIISSDMAELIAWYIAEGSLSKTAVQFTFGSTETQYIDRIKQIAKRLELHSYDADNGNGAHSISVHSVDLADFLSSNCGSGSWLKHIPFDLISGHEDLVYKTLILGDGCEVKTKKEEFHLYVTVSESLAYDMQLLASTLGYRASIYRRQGGESIIEGRVVSCRPSFSVPIKYKQIQSRYRPQSQIRPGKHGVGVKVKDIQEYKYAGSVYNLAVDYDESYVVEGRVVHNCSWEASLVGAYFATEMRIAREQGRICGVPVQNGIPVNTYWDLGIGDSTAIWLAQNAGKEIHLVGYYESSGEGLSHYVNWLNDWRSERNVTFDYHVLPHDAGSRQIQTGKTTEEFLRELHLGPNIAIAARPARKEDSIESARQIFSRCWFDFESTERGIDALSSYRKDYDETNKVFRTRPVHDWSSHCADAFQCLALGYKQAGADDLVGWTPKR